MTVEELLVEEKIKFKQSPADFVVHCLTQSMTIQIQV